MKLYSALWRQLWDWCGSQWKWVWHPELKSSDYLPKSVVIYSVLSVLGMNTEHCGMSQMSKICQGQFNLTFYLSSLKC